MQIEEVIDEEEVPQGIPQFNEQTDASAAQRFFASAGKEERAALAKELGFVLPQQ